MDFLQIGINAFLMLAIVYMVGELIGTFSKAWIPSVFVIAVLFLLGYWSGLFPSEIYSIAGFGPVVTKGTLPEDVTIGTNLATVVILLLITHMGTSISINELKQQWKVIAVTLAGLVGMVLFDWFIAGLFVSKEYIIAGIPPLTGGIIAATTMRDAALDAGLQEAAVLAICMYVIQGFVGYPLTSVMLKREGRKLLKEYRSGNVNKVEAALANEDGKLLTESQKSGKKKLIPEMPAKYQSTAFFLAKLAVSGVISYYLSLLTGGKVSSAVFALIIGILLCEIGFLEKDILRKSGCFNFLIYILMLYVFDGLKLATPEMMVKLAFPIAVIIFFGVLGMAIFSFIAGKLVKLSTEMSIATSLTALYGFPPNYILTDEASKALAETDDEKTYLMDNMLPQMLVGGFVTVTITSVLIAGVFAGWL